MADPDFDKLLEHECRRLEALPAPAYPLRVLVNIYDLDERYGWTKNLGVGLFHTAVEVGGREVGYGGHQYKGTGVFFARPLSMEPPAVFYKQLCLGTTPKGYGEVAQIVREMAAIWTGANYHLIKHNCNHFTEELVIRLCGRSALPNFVNRAACVADALGCDRCIGGARRRGHGQLDLNEGPKVKRA